jgi:hypothetical protein
MENYLEKIIENHNNLESIEERVYLEYKNIIDETNFINDLYNNTTNYFNNILNNLMNFLDH